MPGPKGQLRGTADEVLGSKSQGGLTILLWCFGYIERVQNQANSDYANSSPDISLMAACDIVIHWTWLPNETHDL